MEKGLKIGDKVKGFKFEDRYGITEWVAEMDDYIGKVGVVKILEDGSDTVCIDFGDDYWWYPIEEAINHKINNNTMERIYTEATPLLKEIWKLYGGKKDGFLCDETTFFDNCDQDYNTGGFYASRADEALYQGEDENYKHKSEQEFIQLMEFDQELIDEAIDNLESNHILDRANESAESYLAVHSPKHYTDGKIEVIDFIEDKGLGFHLGNCVKYVARAGKKDPNKTKEDLNKAIWYIKRYIDTYLTDDEKATDNL